MHRTPGEVSMKQSSPARCSRFLSHSFFFFVFVFFFNLRGTDFPIFQEGKNRREEAELRPPG